MLNLDAQTFAGDSAVISLDSSDEFLVKNALISSANPVQITDSRSVELQNLTITGSPGITFDESSGTIDQISIDCLTGGAGSMFSIHEAVVRFRLMMSSLKIVPQDSIFMATVILFLSQSRLSTVICLRKRLYPFFHLNTISIHHLFWELFN